MKIAVVGATGLVGSTMLQILAERNFPVTEIVPVASEKSKGKQIDYNGKQYEVVTLAEGVAAKPDIALFSAGGATSLAWAEKYAAVGTFVIDNSSAWRMDKDKKLIVPEVNAHVLTPNDKIIANPNCSTIQMVVVLYPLHQKYSIKRVVVSTYQSVSGSGQKGVNHLLSDIAGNDERVCYAHPINQNVIPQIDVFLEDGNTKEEHKMILETQKIIGDDNIRVSATTVRVPVIASHSESVNIEFANDFDIKEVVDILKNAPGVMVQDNTKENIYPMPILSAGKDEVFVGRIRRDNSQPNTLNCWIVADNLRKGAATNAVQIAEYIVQQGWVKS